jgi:hypothetical protein
MNVATDSHSRVAAFAPIIPTTISTQRRSMTAVCFESVTKISTNLNKPVSKKLEAVAYRLAEEVIISCAMFAFNVGLSRQAPLKRHTTIKIYHPTTALQRCTSESEVHMLPQASLAK